MCTSLFTDHCPHTLTHRTTLTRATVMQVTSRSHKSPKGCGVRRLQGNVADAAFSQHTNSCNHRVLHFALLILHPVEAGTCRAVALRRPKPLGCSVGRRQAFLPIRRVRSRDAVPALIFIGAPRALVGSSSSFQPGRAPRRTPGQQVPRNRQGRLAAPGRRDGGGHRDGLGRSPSPLVVAICAGTPVWGRLYGPSGHPT